LKAARKVIKNQQFSTVVPFKGTVMVIQPDEFVEEEGPLAHKNSMANFLPDGEGGVRGSALRSLLLHLLE